MKLFKCQSCHQILYFENDVCVKCGHKLGYVPEVATLSAVEPEGELWRALASPEVLYRFCANEQQAACNWLVASTSPETFCLSCRHNRTIPDLTIADNPNLTNVDMSSLTTVSGHLDISGNIAAGGLELGSLTNVGGAVNMADNTSADSIDLGSLVSAGGITITSNTSASRTRCARRGSGPSPR